MNPFESRLKQINGIDKTIATKSVRFEISFNPLN